MKVSEYFILIAMLGLAACGTSERKKVMDFDPLAPMAYIEAQRVQGE